MHSVVIVVALALGLAGLGHLDARAEGNGATVIFTPGEESCFLETSPGVWECVHLRQHRRLHPERQNPHHRPRGLRAAGRRHRRRLPGFPGGVPGLRRDRRRQREDTLDLPPRLRPPVRPECPRSRPPRPWAGGAVLPGIPAMTPATPNARRSDVVTIDMTNHEDAAYGARLHTDLRGQRSCSMTTSTKTETISRRSALAGLGAGGLGVALAATTRPAAAQEATPFPMAGHPLVGTWIVDRNPADPTEIPTYNVLTADGGVIDPTVGGAGVWEATGPDTANFTLTGTIAELGGYFLVRGSLVVDAGGGTATASYSSTIVAADGTTHGRTHAGAGHGPLRADPDRAAGRRGATAGRVPGVDAAAARHPDGVTLDTGDRDDGPGNPPRPTGDTDHATMPSMRTAQPQPSDSPPTRDSGRNRPGHRRPPAPRRCPGRHPRSRDLDRTQHLLRGGRWTGALARHLPSE